MNSHSSKQIKISCVDSRTLGLVLEQGVGQVGAPALHLQLVEGVAPQHPEYPLPLPVLRPVYPRKNVQASTVALQLAARYRWQRPSPLLQPRRTNPRLGQNRLVAALSGHAEGLGPEGELVGAHRQQRGGVAGHLLFHYESNLALVGAAPLGRLLRSGRAVPGQHCLLQLGSAVPKQQAFEFVGPVGAEVQRGGHHLGADPPLLAGLLAGSGPEGRAVSSGVGSGLVVGREYIYVDGGGGVPDEIEGLFVRLQLAGHPAGIGCSFPALSGLTVTGLAEVLLDGLAVVVVAEGEFGEEGLGVELGGGLVVGDGGGRGVGAEGTRLHRVIQQCIVGQVYSLCFHETQRHLPTLLCSVLASAAFPFPVPSYKLTMDTLGCLFLLLCLLAPGQSKLVQLVAFVAPGARYHTNDLYDGGQFRDKWYQLTPVGLRQMQQLGTRLRQQYITSGHKLLPEDWAKGQYEHYSIQMDSSIQSTLALLYGLYPLGKGQKMIAVDSRYHHPPFDRAEDAADQTHALPEGQLVAPMSYSSQILLEDCPKEFEEMQKNTATQKVELDEMNLTYTPFFRRMAEAFNLTASSVDLAKVAQLADTVRVDRFLGRPLPEEATAGDVSNLEHLMTYWQLALNKFNLSKAYNSGKFKHVLDLFDGRRGGKGGARWSTLGIFDGDLYSALNDLNVSSPRCVEELFRRGSTQALNCATAAPFASSLLFELHQEDANYQVRLRFNGKYVNLCEREATSCDYEEWRARLGQYILPDPMSVCGGKRVAQAQSETQTQPQIVIA